MNEILAGILKGLLNAAARPLMTAYDEHPEWRRFIIVATVTGGVLIAVLVSIIST
jgi:hypothetical protein